MSIVPDDSIDPIAARPDATRAPLTAWRLIGWVIIWLLASFLGALVFGFFIGVVIAVTGLKGKLGPTDSTMLYTSVGVLGASIFLTWIALGNGARAGGGDARAGVGDRTISHPLVIGLICVILVAYAAAITFGALNASAPLRRNLSNMSAWIVSVNFVAIVVAAPLAEELFFRGWIWTELQGRWSVLTIAVVTSSVWLALHAPEGIGRMTLLLPLAIALPLARHFGRSVRAPIILHACNNAATAAMPWISLWFGWLAIP